MGTCSTTFNNVSFADPYISGSTLYWASTFTIPANSTRTLIFQATLPATPGTYTNSATARIGNAVYGTYGQDFTGIDGAAFMVVALLVLTVANLDAGTSPKGPLSPSKSLVAYAKHAVQGYNMQVWISNQMCLGLQAWDAGAGSEIPLSPHYGLQYPVGNAIEHLYGCGPWIGGIVNGVRRVTEGYNGDTAAKFFLPDQKHPSREKIWATSTKNIDEPNQRGVDDDGDGKIDEDDLDGIDNDGDWVLATDDVGSDGIPDSLESGCRGGYNAATNPDPAFDDYRPAIVDSCHPIAPGSFRLMNDRDLYTEGNGLADHGEPEVDEDYGALSWQDLYCSATDTVTVPGHVPLGIKVIQKSYAWPDAAWEGILPFEYTFINIGNNVIKEPFLAFFADMDVGPDQIPNYFAHNYSCYVDSLRTAYVDNPVDHGSTPIGLTLLSSTKPLDQLNFVYHWFTFSTQSMGTVDSVLYEWMSGQVTPTEPIEPCMSPSNPSDVRFLMSFGPFADLHPGDTVRAVMALVGGESIDVGPNDLISNARKAIRNSLLTGVSETTADSPESFRLLQNYPNPFNPTTTIRYELPKGSYVTLRVYDLLGRVIRTLVDGYQDAGYRSLTFNAGNLPSGIYFYSLRTGSFSDTKRLMILK